MPSWCNGSTSVFKTVSMGSNPVEGAININKMEDLKTKVVELRKEGCTYKAIRLKCGNPSNKEIRAILLEHCPELAGDSEEWIALQKRVYKS